MFITITFPAKNPPDLGELRPIQNIQCNDVVPVPQNPCKLKVEKGHSTYWQEIPVSCGNFIYSNKIILNNSLLIGTIPAAIKNLQKVTLLDLSSNSLSGRILLEIGSITTSLTISLDLSSNKSTKILVTEKQEKRYHGQEHLESKLNSTRRLRLHLSSPATTASQSLFLTTSPVCFIDLEWDYRRPRLLCSLQIGHSGVQEATYFYPNDFHPPHTSAEADLKYAFILGQALIINYLMPLLSTYFTSIIVKTLRRKEDENYTNTLQGKQKS
ncbi:hypothetical protein L1887_18548 [Cichorium endivia]|nr:hypothetical protein L1887_18548 [Cichorium endivia]